MTGIVKALRPVNPVSGAKKDVPVGLTWRASAYLALTYRWIAPALSATGQARSAVDQASPGWASRDYGS